MAHEIQSQQPRAFLVGLDYPASPAVLDVEASLEELALLADTAGIHVVGQIAQRLKRPEPATFIGRGKVDEVRMWVEELGASMVIFDDELSPRHQRELEEFFGENVRVLDRTTLILDIFAQHAHTREGALQVELAQYEYRLPRLTRQWTHLARQAGGASARGGAAGVGLRGPGETQLEVDRREIRRRISHLQAQLEAVRAHRERQSLQRRRMGTPVVALVGYTNAGKSTLLNCLSGAQVYVADQLFATLDPTIRRVELASGWMVLFSDTVGFIQKLPHSLIAAFRATLEEIAEAAALLHVVDASHPNAEEQIEVVEATLKDELGIKDIPSLLVFNKIDRVAEDNPERFGNLCARYPEAIHVSALHGVGIDRLLAATSNLLLARRMSVVVQVPYDRGELIARFYEVGIVEAVSHEAGFVRLKGKIDMRYLHEYETYRVR